MPITDDRTAHLNLPKPYADNMLEADSDRIRTAFDGFDTAIFGKQANIGYTPENAAMKGVANGYPSLGSDSKIPAGQLPSFVDDVLEFATFGGLPATGEAGKIYVVIATNKTYRWSGSVYTEIASSPGSTDVVSEGSTNKYFTDARALAAIPLASPTVLGKVKIGAGLGIDGAGLLFASAGGGSVMTLVDVVPASNGVSTITVPAGYVVGAILVAFNGSLLSPSDYTATTGTTIGLVGFTAGTVDTFTIISLATVSIGTLPAASVGTTQLAAGSVTLAKLDPAAYGTSGSSKLLQLDAAGKLPSIDGSQLTGVGKQIQSIGASVASNALTVTAAALTLDFRSTTLGSGVVSTIAGAPANIVVPASATLGTVSAIQSRIVVIALNNGGTIELAVVNNAGGIDLTETGVINTTAISAASSAANVAYSGAARSGVAYRVIGYIDSTQAVAGTWATTPSAVQGYGGQALAAMASLGYGQTWQSPSRAAGVTYYNTTGKPIFVHILSATSGGGAGSTDLIIGGVALGSSYASASNQRWAVSGIVPPGVAYSCNIANGFGAWSELR